MHTISSLENWLTFIYYLFSADGMLFGALKPCPLCSGHIHYSGGMYRCGGFLSAWSKCSYSNTEPERVKWKWKIPEGTSNSYLCKVVSAYDLSRPLGMGTVDYFCRVHNILFYSWYSIVLYVNLNHG